MLTLTVVVVCVYVVTARKPGNVCGPATAATFGHAHWTYVVVANTPGPVSVVSRRWQVVVPLTQLPVLSHRPSTGAGGVPAVARRTHRPQCCGNGPPENDGGNTPRVDLPPHDVIFKRGLSKVPRL